MRDYLQAWIDVTGRRTTYAQISQSEYESLWGKEFGEEMVVMFKTFEVGNKDYDRAHRPNVISAEDLGIAKEDLIGHKTTLEREKHRL